MESKIRKFLEILKIEFEDLISDLEFSETVLAKRLAEHEITEYVFLENIGLLKREMLGIGGVKRLLNDSAADLHSVEDIREVVENYFHDEIKAAGLPNVVFLLVNRKLDKVARYMSLDE